MSIRLSDQSIRLAVFCLQTDPFRTNHGAGKPDTDIRGPVVPVPWGVREMSAGTEQWILRPFNGVFFAVFAGFLLLLTAASLLLRGKSERVRINVLTGACLVTLAGFFVYKYYLSIDSDYNLLTVSKGGFNWWGELPLQLCNINMILIPVAVQLNSRPLKSFCFFAGALGALMALMMPGMGFDGYSILLPRMIGFFGTHFMVLIEAIAIVSFGLYRPKFRDMPLTLAAILVVSLSVFGINMLLRFTGLYPNANYFFSVETEGNPVLELFYRWLPYPYLFLLPCYLILCPYMALITLGFTLADRAKERKKAAVS